MPKVPYVNPEYPTEKVFAAAVAAQRVNLGKYHKMDQKSFDDQTNEVITHFLANKTVTKNILQGDCSEITPEDYEVGEKVRNHMRGVSFKVLREEVVGEWERTAYRIAENSVINSNWDVAIVPSIVDSYYRHIQRTNTNERLDNARGGHIGSPGEKVEITIEVVRCLYSKEYGTYILTGITKEEKKVFFFNGRKREVGEVVNIKGKVKRHLEDSTTQLNYVKEI